MDDETAFKKLALKRFAGTQQRETGVRFLMKPHL